MLDIVCIFSLPIHSSPFAGFVGADLAWAAHASLDRRWGASQLEYDVLEVTVLLRSSPLALLRLLETERGGVVLKLDIVLSSGESFGQ